jgi:hypothetical protein
MADKTVKIKVDIDTASSIADLKALKAELKKTAAGSAEFTKLYNAIDDLEDKIKSAKNQSSDWVDSLESAGGPLGALGASINKLKVSTQSFGAALKATGIGLLVSLVAGLAAAFSQSDEAAKKFEPILIALQRILGGILEALSPLIDGFIEFATTALPYVSKAVSVAYSAVTALFQSLGKLGSAIGKLVKGDFSGAWEDAKASVTSFSTNFEAAQERYVAGTKKLTKIEKENLKERNEAQKAAADEAKRIKAEELKELSDGQKEAFLELLSEREAEEYKVNEHYANLLYLATKYGDDTTQLKLAQANALKEIDDKYLKEARDKQDKEDEEKKKKYDEFSKFQMEQYEKIKELEQNREDLTFKTNQVIGQSWVDLGTNISGILQNLTTVFEQGSTAQKVFAVAAVLINAASSIGQILLNGAASQAEYNKAIATGNAAILMGIPKLVNPITAGIGIAEIAAGKAAVTGAIAGKAATKVNTTLQVAAVGASSAIQVAAILSAKKAGGGGGGGASGGGGGAVNIAPPTVAAVGAPQIQSGQGINAGQQLGETIGGQMKGVRAYVVSQDIQNQSALDRRTNRAATFSGG